MSTRYSLESPLDERPLTMSSPTVSLVASQSKKRPSTSMASTPPGDRKSSSVFISNGPATPSSGAITPRKSKFDALLSTQPSQMASVQKDSVKEALDPKVEVDSLIFSPAPMQSFPKRTRLANTRVHSNMDQPILLNTDTTTSTRKSGIPEPDFATPAPRMRKPLRQPPMSVDTLSSPLALSSLRLTTHTHDTAATATTTPTSARIDNANADGNDEGENTHTPQQQRSMSTTSSSSKFPSPASAMLVDKDGFATPVLPRSHAFRSGKKSGKKPGISNNVVSGMDSSLLFPFSSVPSGSVTATPMPTDSTIPAAAGRAGVSTAGVARVEVGVGQKRTPGNPYRNIYTGTGTPYGISMGVGTPGGVMTPRMLRGTGADDVVTPRVLRDGAAGVVGDVVTPRIGQAPVLISQRRHANINSNINTSGNSHSSGSGNGRKRAIAAVAMPSTPAPSFMPYGSPAAPTHAMNLSIDTGVDTTNNHGITSSGIEMSPNTESNTSKGTGMGISGDWAASSVSLSDTTSQLYQPQSSIPTLPAMASMALYQQLPMSGASPIAVAHNALQLLRTLGSSGQSLGNSVQTPRSGWTPRNGVFTPRSNYPQTPRTPLYVRGLFRPSANFPYSGFSETSGIVGVPLPLPSPGMPFTPMSVSQQSFFSHNDGLKSPASTQMLEEYGISESMMDMEDTATMVDENTREVDAAEDEAEEVDAAGEIEAGMDTEGADRAGTPRPTAGDAERQGEDDDWFSVDMMRRAGMEEAGNADGNRELDEGVAHRAEVESEKSQQEQRQEPQQEKEQADGERQASIEVDQEHAQESESMAEVETRQEGASLEEEEEGVEVEAVVVAASPRAAVEDMASVRARYDAMVAAAVKTFEGEEGEGAAQGEDVENAATADHSDVDDSVDANGDKDGVGADNGDGDLSLTSSTAVLLSMPLFGAYDIDTSLMHSTHTNTHAHTQMQTPAHNTSRSVYTPHTLDASHISASYTPSAMDTSLTVSTLSTPYGVSALTTPYSMAGLTKSLFDTPMRAGTGASMGVGMGVFDVNAVAPRRHGGLFSPASTTSSIDAGVDAGRDAGGNNSNTHFTSNSTAAEHDITTSTPSAAASELTASLYAPAIDTTPYTSFKPLSFDVRLSVAESIVSRLLLSTQQSIAMQNQLTIPLSTADIAQADAIIHNTPLRTVLYASNTAEVTGEKIKALSGQGWLNDDIVNGYMSLLLERARREYGNTAEAKTQCLPQCSFPAHARLKIHIFSSNFFTKLCAGGGYDYNGVRRWSKSQKVNINSLDRLIIPCHINGNHWTLCMADLQRKQIEYYDSLRGEQPHMMESLLKYIIDEAKQYDNKDISGEVTSWRIVSPKDIPTQRNGYDCGVFVCANANILSRGGRISLHDVDPPVIEKNTNNKIPKNPDFGMGRDRHGTRFALDSNANVIEEGDSLLKGLYSLSLGKKKAEAKRMDLPFTGEDMANFRRRIALDIANKKVI